MRIVPIEALKPRTGTGERRQPESNRCRVPVAGIVLATIVALIAPPPAGAKCRTKECWKRVRIARAEAWLKRERPAVWYYRREPEAWKRWSRATAWCESNLRWHIATGNGYYGAHQWLPSTWYSAMRLIPARARTRAMPHHSRPELQSLVAIRYARTYGTGAWPNCG